MVSRIGAQGGARQKEDGAVNIMERAARSQQVGVPPPNLCTTIAQLAFRIGRNAGRWPRHHGAASMKVKDALCQLVGAQLPSQDIIAQLVLHIGPQFGLSARRHGAVSIKEKAAPHQVGVAELHLHHMIVQKALRTGYEVGLWTKKIGAAGTLARAALRLPVAALDTVQARSRLRTAVCTGIPSCPSEGITEAL